MKSLLIVEDDRLLRQRLQADALASAPGWRVYMADSIASAQEHVRVQRLDVAFIDLGLPDGDGLRLIHQVRHAHPTCEILVITVFADEQRVLRSLQAGASGYLVKSDLPHFAGRLLSTLESGGSPVSPAIARSLIERLRPMAAAARGPTGQGAKRLSSREAEIRELCAKGLRYAEIASALRIGISNAPARPEDTAATRHDGTSAAAISWQRCPFGAPRRSPGAAPASICCLDHRVDPHLATPRPLGAQRRPAALRRCSLRMRC